MQKKITITGSLGSGKSSVCKKLSQIFGFTIISVGEIQRRLAERHQMTINEFNIYMESHPSIDLECDAMVTELGKKTEGLIFDSRLAWNFVPDSFKVYLTVKAEIAAERIFGDRDRKNEEQINQDMMLDKIVERRASEKTRFQMRYGLDIEDTENYDLVIDTSLLSVEKNAEIISDAYNKSCQNLPFDKFHS